MMRDGVRCVVSRVVKRCGVVFFSDEYVWLEGITNCTFYLHGFRNNYNTVNLMSTVDVCQCTENRTASGLDTVK